MQKKRISLAYWNTNNVATAVVAVANYTGGTLFDWVAYIGGTIKTQYEEDAYAEIAKHGAKLDTELAVHFARRGGWHELIAGAYRP